jgi:hypothetical protein
MKIKESIAIASDHKRDLAKKFNTSKVTVQNALHFFNNSDLAVKIRAAAKEILLAEAQKI